MSSASGQQFRREMEACWEVVDKLYDSESILGRRASQTMLLFSARSSHHDLPIAVSLMAGFAACSNGACIQAFPGKPSPLAIAPQNINYPQTRKSAISGLLAGVGESIDRDVYRKALRKEQEWTDGRRGDRDRSEDEEPQSGLKVVSSTLTTFTEAAFFHRCSGDFNQVPDSKAGAQRIHFGTLVNLDEAYKLYRMLGLLGVEGHSKSTSGPTTVAESASEFNRLMQTGTSSMATKTSGSFGDGKCPTISVGLAGNAHPAMVVPMDRGEIGANHVASKERLLFVSGRPIEPHSALPPRLELPPGIKRWTWPQLMKCMLEPLGLPKGVDQPTLAAATLQLAREAFAEDELDDDDDEQDEFFYPDASGFVITLMDGTTSRLRFLKVKLGAAEVLQPYFRVANRALDVPPGQNVNELADRLLRYFSNSHMEIPLTESARLALTGLGTCFNAQCALARDRGDVLQAARLGIAPWHLAMLSAGLLLTEIAVGDYTGTLALESRQLHVEQHHVIRAFDLLTVLHQMRDEWSVSIRRDAVRQAEENAAVEEATRRAAAAGPPGGARKPEGFAAWQPTQQTAKEERLPSLLQEYETQAATQRDGREVTDRILLPSDPGIPAMSYGYGVDGAQVQRADLGEVILKDREVMRATILRGEAIAYGADVCGSISRKQDAADDGQQGKRPKKVSLKLAHWEAVMQAALQQYRVGVFVPAASADGVTVPGDAAERAMSKEKKKRGSYIQLHLPPQEDETMRLLYNNRLVEMCQVTYATFVDAAGRRQEKARPKEVAGAADAADRDTDRRAAGAALQGAIGSGSAPSAPSAPSTAVSLPGRRPPAPRRAFGGTGNTTPSDGPRSGGALRVGAVKRHLGE